MEFWNLLIRRILRIIIDTHKSCGENFPYALLGYRNTILTSNKATPYILVYKTTAVILAEVEIPSLIIIQKDGLNDVKWVCERYMQLVLIDEKRMSVICHRQLYQ